MSKGVFVALVAGSVIALDQLTKWLIREELALHDGFAVIPGFFSIIHAANRGAAFSLFADAHDGVRLPFFFIAAVVAIGFLVYFIRQVAPSQRLLLFALAGVLGGAIGNLIDRVLFGAVTDFILVHYRGWSWPAFNIADSFITIGVIILIAHSLFAHDDPSAAHAGAEHG